MNPIVTNLKTDHKQRLSLTKPLKALSQLLDFDTENITFSAYIKDGNIILEPQVSIPAQEMWLWKNQTAMKQVQQGLADSAKQKTSDLGSFAEYLDDAA